VQKGCGADPANVERIKRRRRRRRRRSHLAAPLHFPKT
jgi:hypothetical protein